MCGAQRSLYNRAGAAARIAEEAKERKYHEAAFFRGNRILGAAVENYGALGPGMAKLIKEIAKAGGRNVLCPYRMEEIQWALIAELTANLHDGNRNLVDRATIRGVV